MKNFFIPFSFFGQIVDDDHEILQLHLMQTVYLLVAPVSAAAKAAAARSLLDLKINPFIYFNM